jgi:hypothetical protein
LRICIRLSGKKTWFTKFSKNHIEEIVF